MPNRVIATGPAPSDPNQALLNQGAQGIGAGLGARIGQNMATRRLARDIDPLREALLQSMGQNYQPATPQEALIAAAAQDPRLFAQLTGSAQGAVNVAGMLGAAPQEAYDVQRLVTGDSELGQSLGLAAGQQARVKFSYDARGNLIGQPSLAANPLSDDEGGDTGPFGASVKGRALGYISNLAPAFSEGKLTPEQERVFLTSINDYTQPEQFTDPDTGLVRTRRNELPRFARQALEQRGYKIEGESIIPPVQAPPNPADINAAGQAQQSSAGVATRPADVPTLFEMAQAGNVNNPIAALRRFGTRFGLNAQAEMSAATAATTLKERIVKALQQSPRYAEGEAERIGAGFQLDPETLATNDRYMQRAIAADDTLARIQQENYEVITGKRALVPGETRQHAMATFNAISNARQWLIPPRVESVEQLDNFLRTSAPGTVFLVPGEREGTWETYRVPEPQ